MYVHFNFRMETELELAKNVKSKLEESIRILESQNFNSEARIEELLKEIIERDNILIPKERRVHQMKTRAEGYKQELQILKMRNEEVERAMKPKDDRIEELDTKIEAVSISREKYQNNYTCRYS